MDNVENELETHWIRMQHLNRQVDEDGEGKSFFFFTRKSKTLNSNYKLIAFRDFLKK